MLGAIHDRLVRLATWPVVALLLVGFLACQQGFAWRQRELGAALPAPDMRFGYTPGEICKLFQDWGAERRDLYAWTEVTLDLAFPLIYGTLLAALAAQLFPEGGKRWSVLVPIFAALADVLENVTMAFLAWSYDGTESPLVRAAACFTVAKITLFVGSLLLLLVGGVAGLRREAT